MYVSSQAEVESISLVPAGTRTDTGYISGRAPGARGPTTVRGLPLVKPPYGQISAIDLKTGAILWQIANGDTPDEIRNHPDLKGLNIPRTGRIGPVSTLVTKTLVIAGERGFVTMSDGRRGAMMRAYDKATGKELGAIYLRAPQTGGRRMTLHGQGPPISRHRNRRRVHRPDPCGVHRVPAAPAVGKDFFRHGESNRAGRMPIIPDKIPQPRSCRRPIPDGDPWFRRTVRVSTSLSSCRSADEVVGHRYRTGAKTAAVGLIEHKEHTNMKPKNTICLWFDKDAHAEARFYAVTFPDSKVTAVHEAPGDYPGGKKGEVLTVEFTVLGIPCLGLNAGPAFRHTEAFSFQVATENPGRDGPLLEERDRRQWRRRKASAVGARTAGASPGRSPRAR